MKAKAKTTAKRVFFGLMIAGQLLLSGAGIASAAPVAKPVASRTCPNGGTPTKEGGCVYRPGGWTCVWTVWGRVFCYRPDPLTGN